MSVLKRSVVTAMLSLCVVATAACGPRTGIASPSASAQSSGANSSPTPNTVLGVRTVLSPLGLNIRSAADPTSKILQSVPEGSELTALDYNATQGGWFKVDVTTAVGWVSADPSLTALGTFTTYHSDAHQFTALYPDTWTFAEAQAGVVFRPQTGGQSIIAKTAATKSDLGFGLQGGYTKEGGEDNVVVCGVTTSMLIMKLPGVSSTPTLTPHTTAIATTSATPTGATPAALPLRAQIVLELDAAHTLGLDYQYNTADELQLFRNFYNSVKFPFPQCEK